ncbi:hypothetical protein BBJ28_00018442 [Nothophytophthora sp. Chile5]|nr:hypothetical protein BBJ28_00018442 [Nothophytophthora sp. Chile5]
MKNGLWSEDEHDRFLMAIKEFPRGPWSAIAQSVGTRSVRQVQTHTQKYYEKIMRRMRGLRKDRKTWARVEHRIDDDILEFCELMNAFALAGGELRRDADSSSEPEEEEEEEEEKEEAAYEPLNVGSVNALTLPPFEEALDFLIEVMEE